LEIKLEDIKAAPYNPRIINEKSLEGLEKSLDKFGDISGITWNKRTGYLVTGHQRISVLKKTHKNLNIKNGQLYDGETPLEFTVRIVDWDEETEKAANITANNHQVGGVFDTDMLYALVDEIKDIDMSLYEDLLMPDLQKDLGIYFDPAIIDSIGETKRESLPAHSPDVREEYENNDSRRIFINLEGEELRLTMERCVKIMEKEKIDTIAKLFVFLVGRYEGL